MRSLFVCEKIAISFIFYHRKPQISLAITLGLLFGTFILAPTKHRLWLNLTLMITLISDVLPFSNIAHLGAEILQYE